LVGVVPTTARLSPNHLSLNQPLPPLLRRGVRFEGKRLYIIPDVLAVRPHLTDVDNPTFARCQ
jgi:hypothetical protein